MALPLTAQAAKKPSVASVGTPKAPTAPAAPKLQMPTAGKQGGPLDIKTGAPKPLKAVSEQPVSNGLYSLMPPNWLHDRMQRAFKTITAAAIDDITDASDDDDTIDGKYGDLAKLGTASENVRPTNTPSGAPEATDKRAYLAPSVPPQAMQQAKADINAFVPPKVPVQQPQQFLGQQDDPQNPIYGKTDSLGHSIFAGPLGLGALNGAWDQPMGKGAGFCSQKQNQYADLEKLADSIADPAVAAVRQVVGLSPSQDEEDKEQEKLDKAVNRNMRERKARRIAASQDELQKVARSPAMLRALRLAGVPNMSGD